MCNYILSEWDCARGGELRKPIDEHPWGSAEGKAGKELRTEAGPSQFKKKAILIAGGPLKEVFSISLWRWQVGCCRYVCCPVSIGAGPSTAGRARECIDSV